MACTTSNVTFTHPAKIMKRSVDHWKKGMPFPYCRLAIHWRGEDTPVFPEVSRRVALFGAKHPYDHFFIQLPEQLRSLPLSSDLG